MTIKKKCKGELYRTFKVPMPQMQEEDFKKLLTLRREAGWIWNSLISYHRWIRSERRSWPTMQDLARQMTGHTAPLGLSLGTQSQNLLFDEFLGVVKTAQQNRETGVAAGGIATARFPWHEREARDTHWDRRDARFIAGKGILLSLALAAKPGSKSLCRRPPLLIPYRGGIPKNCTALTIHYAVEDRCFYILFKIKEKRQATPSTGKVMGVDLGQIRIAVATTEEGETLNIKGRGLRSIQQGHHKKKAFRSGRIDRAVKGSHRRRKEVAKRRRESQRVRHQKDNFLHTSSRRIVDFAALHGVKFIFVGDAVGVRDHDTGKKQNQANSDWPIAVLTRQITYKADALGMDVKCVEEAYTSRDCPQCRHRKTHSVSGRVYRCRECGLEAHRDAVGAWNIQYKAYVNMHGHQPHFKKVAVAFATQKYLTPVGVRGVRTSPIPRNPIGWCASAEQSRSAAPRAVEARPRNSERRGTSPVKGAVQVVSL